jgi:hypothetical protein
MIDYQAVMRMIAITTGSLLDMGSAGNWTRVVHEGLDFTCAGMTAAGFGTTLYIPHQTRIGFATFLYI